LRAGREIEDDGRIPVKVDGINLVSVPAGRADKFASIAKQLVEFS
jgi:hypothetical protein